MAVFPKRERRTASADAVGRTGFWARLLWALIYPRRRHRTTPTIAGGLLILLSFGVGTAAYNAGNNILFITLSLMLACLVLSGVLSWLNFRRLTWRLEVAPPLRVGQPATVGLRVTNAKRILPSYGLWFELVARPVETNPIRRAETTFTARGLDVKAALARADAGERGRVPLTARIDPRGEARLEWTFVPAARGKIRIELERAGSLFPFGFLQKSLATDEQGEVVVWPAAVSYRRQPVAVARSLPGGERLARGGAGSDLLALRRYELGDSHRLIHWKASARSRRLLVRQFAAESAIGFALWFETEAVRWPRAEQFERAVALATTLAEDLFRAGRLTGARVDRDPLAPIRQVRDLEAFLDRLAVVERAGDGAARGGSPGGTSAPRHQNVVTFSPEGGQGVVARANDRVLAQT